MEVLGRKIGRVHAAALTLGALSALSGCAHHGHNKHHFAGGQGGISVSGSGEAHGAPDIARTTAGVEVRAATAEEATALAATQMQKLIDALKTLGIADRDLRTQGYSVSYERDYQPPPAPAPVRAAGVRVQAAPAPVVLPGRYLVTNSVEITVRNVSDLGKVLSTATGAGANNVWGISFDIEDREPLVGKARELALAQAEARAAQVAELSGLKLGPIVSITDGSQGGGGVVAPFARMAMNSAVPVERGELAVSHEVQVQYAIAGKAEHHHDGHPHNHGGHPHHQHPHDAPTPVAPPAPVVPVAPALTTAPVVNAPAPAAPVAAPVGPVAAPVAAPVSPVAAQPQLPAPAVTKPAPASLPAPAAQPAPAVPPVPPLPAVPAAHVTPPSAPPASAAAPVAPAARVQATAPASTPLIVPAAAPAKAAPAAPAKVAPAAPAKATPAAPAAAVSTPR